MRELITRMFSGPLETVICERSNQQLRDAELRDGWSKVVARLRPWEVLRRSHLLEHYQLPEVPMQPPVGVPSGVDLNTIFKHSSSEQQLNLAGVMGEQNWATFNSQIVKRLFAEAQALLVAHQNDNAEVLNNSWMTDLLPEKQVIIIRPDVVQEAYMCVANLGCSAIVWPLKKHERLIELRTDIAGALPWRALSSLDGVFVLPTQAASPLHAMLARRSGKDVPLGIFLKNSGKPVPLLQWHQRRGFANVHEGTLERLRNHLGVDTLGIGGDVPGLHVGDGLACALVMHLNPKISSDELMAAMAARRSQSTEGTGFEEDEKRAKAKKRRASIQSLIQSLAPRLSKSKAKPSRASVEVDARIRQHGARWWNGIEGSEDVMALRPEESCVIIDNSNGRYLIHHRRQPGSRVSVSWTKRGMGEATRLVLSKLWAWELEFTGRACPLPTELVGDVSVLGCSPHAWPRGFPSSLPSMRSMSSGLP